jgi:L-2-hydroxyglutarate oxidase
MKKNKTCDVLIVGGGIVGSSIARNLAMKHPKKKIILIEKDNKLGMHNSTLNSGVIHAGLYYPKNSLRKKYCIKGNTMLTEYHKEKNIPLRHCGKLIAPKNAREIEGLMKLYKQGIENGVDLKLISAGEALKIEPNLKIKGDFPVIFSPNTKVGNPTMLIEEVQKDLNELSNVEIIFKSKPEKVIKSDKKHIVVETCNNNETIECNFFINAAGLYSDKIAKLFNFGHHYDLLPVVGTYLVDKLSTNFNENSIGLQGLHKNNLLKTLVYPIPQITGNNFLGVHTTITTDGFLKIGPTALPCLWREQHNGIKSMNIKETLDILAIYFKLLISDNRDFLFSLINKQIKNLFSHNIIKEGKSLVTIYDTLEDNLMSFRNNRERFKFKIGGIRSQIVNMNSMKLENDFIIEKKDNHMHLLNIISPGWTSALAIADDIIL